MHCCADVRKELPVMAAGLLLQYRGRAKDTLGNLLVTKKVFWKLDEAS